MHCEPKTPIISNNIYYSSLNGVFDRSIISPSLHKFLFPDIGRLRPIKDKLPASIGFGKLKFAIAMLEVHFGVRGESPPVPLSEEVRKNLIGDSKFVPKVSG